jgi:TolA-binding protein
MKRYEEARRNFKYIVDNLQGSDYYSQSLYLFGRCEYLLKNYTAAIEKFDSYLKNYTALDYADNSMYWKAESLIGEGRRNDARTVLNALLKHYPYGNKADAARFKLRLMELEDLLSGQKVETSLIGGEDEMENWRDRELQYRSEIEKLNNRVEMLESEINALKEIDEVTEDESAAQIEEKMEALIAWENILNLKEEALNQKEVQLDQEFERIQELSEQMEQIPDE